MVLVSQNQQTYQHHYSWKYLNFFRTTNFSNDNIAVLETGFNKEIEKNTALLLEQEKQTEVYLAIQKLLDKEAANDLLPEVEAANPAYKLFIQYKADNVSIIPN